MQLLAFTGIAKAFESFDIQIYQALGFGGHALKHIAAAIGMYFIVLLVKTRDVSAAPA